MASATATAATQLFIKPETFWSNKNIIPATAISNKTRKYGLSSTSHHGLIVKSSGGRVAITTTTSDDEDGEGVSLGTMKLPLNTDIPRFQTLLFQWANSLSQGAQLPLPVPLKVDTIQGGVKLGFVDIDDGKTQVFVYINCLVIPGATESDPPKFIATRNGPMKNRVPPGEPRIMKSLQAALQKSVQIATL